MRYLLDVNALIAFGYSAHTFHQRVTSWARSLSSDGVPQFATSSITELGFVRVLCQAYDVRYDEAIELLVNLKTSRAIDLLFIADNNDIENLPSWVKAGPRTTDGHLAGLAKTHKLRLATLDKSIPNSILIPV